VALSKRAPKTFGELRKMLAALGDPWQPDPSRSDDEPLPDYPTGGDGAMEPDERLLGKGGVPDVLKGSPPTNLDLRAEWAEEGLLEDVEEGLAPGQKRSRRKRTRAKPPPSTGG
jgi:hypothetical protein